MNAAAGLRRRHPLVGGSKDGSPIALSAPLCGVGRAEVKERQSLPGSSAPRFAVASLWLTEAHDSTEATHIAPSEELILVPLQWQSIFVLFNSDSSHPVQGQTGGLVQFGNVSVDFSTQEALRGDSPVSLTSIEFKTLKFFVANPYRVFSRDELLNQVWGYDAYPCTRTVDNRILRLRQKLEVDSANPKHFLTVWGTGYKFVP